MQGNNNHVKIDLTNFLKGVATRTKRIMHVDVCGIWLKGETGNFTPKVYYGTKAKIANYLFSKQNVNVLRCLLGRMGAQGSLNPKISLNKIPKKILEILAFRIISRSIFPSDPFSNFLRPKLAISSRAP